MKTKAFLIKKVKTFTYNLEENKKEIQIHNIKTEQRTPH